MKAPAWVYAVPAGLVAVIGVIADKGEGVWKFVGLAQAFMAALPLGVWSVAIALVLSVLVWATVIARAPRASDGTRAHNLANGLAFMAGAGLIIAQQWAAPGSTPEQKVLALGVALVVGLLPPFIGAALRALFRRKPPQCPPDPPQ